MVSALLTADIGFFWYLYSAANNLVAELYVRSGGVPTGIVLQ